MTRLRAPLLLDDAYTRLTQAAHTGAFGANSTPEPTEGQAQAGNYRLGRTLVHGLRVAIEQPYGSIRRGVGPDGVPWSSRMAAHYGYFEGTTGADGDGVDVFIGPFPESKTVFVINQAAPDGSFDEHKTMMGFADERSAREAYQASYELGWHGLASIVPLSLFQLRWWLKSGNKSAALNPADIPQEETMKKAQWNGVEPVGQSFDHVLYELRRHDDAEGLLLDSVTAAEIVEDSDGIIALDALVVEAMHLSRATERLRSIMDRSSQTVKVPAVQLTDPFKARGVTNVAAIYELSDGQTVTVFFHNPDTTPNKLTPMDELISWKWLLNKKDITIVVAPERGVDLNPRTVGQRIMKLAEKNSAAFQRANAKRAERLSSIQGIRDRIAEKEGVLKELLADIEVAEAEREAKNVSESDKQIQFSQRSGAIVSALEAAGVVWSSKDGAYVKNDVRVWISRGAELGTAFLKFTVKGGVGTIHQTVDDDLNVAVEETASKVLAAVESFAQASDDGEVKNDSPLPEGWIESTPGGMATNGDPEAGGILDRSMVSGKWFAVSNKEGVGTLEGFDTRSEALAALIAANANVQQDAPRIDPLSPENYAKVLRDEALQLEYQDELDSYFQGRLIDVRNALRGMGWDGEKFGELTKNGAKLEVQTQRVGAGSNVVGIQYLVTGNVAQGGSDATQDLPEFTALEIAQDIDTKVKKEPEQPSDEAKDTFKVGSVELEAFTKKSARGVRVWGVRVVENGKEFNAADGFGSWFKNDTKANMLADLEKTYQASMRHGDAAENENRWRESFGLAPIAATADGGEQTPAQRVDAAYQFANATDAFKEAVTASVEQDAYSPFLTAKLMDLKAKSLGAEIHWGLTAALDSVSTDEEAEEEEFDPEEEFEAMPDEESEEAFA